MQQVEFTSRDAECVAYLSALITVELCNEIHRDKPNTAIRRCVARLMPRLTEHKRVYLIFQGLAKQVFPSGALHMLRRNLEELADGKVGFYDEVANG